MYITKYEQWLWKITKYLLEDKANFDDKSLSFHLNKEINSVDEGTYSLDKKREDAIHYRLGHVLAQRLMEKAKQLETPNAKISFDYSSSNLNYAELDKLKSKKGILKVVNLEMRSEAEDLDLIVFAFPFIFITR